MDAPALAEAAIPEFMSSLATCLKLRIEQRAPTNARNIQHRAAWRAVDALIEHPEVVGARITPDADIWQADHLDLQYASACAYFADVMVLSQQGPVDPTIADISFDLMKLALQARVVRRACSTLSYLEVRTYATRCGTPCTASGERPQRPSLSVLQPTRTRSGSNTDSPYDKLIDHSIQGIIDYFSAEGTQPFGPMPCPILPSDIEPNCYEVLLIVHKRYARATTIQSNLDLETSRALQHSVRVIDAELDRRLLNGTGIRYGDGVRPTVGPPTIQNMPSVQVGRKSYMRNGPNTLLSYDPSFRQRMPSRFHRGQSISGSRRMALRHSSSATLRDPYNDYRFSRMLPISPNTARMTSLPLHRRSSRATMPSSSVQENPYARRQVSTDNPVGYTIVGDGDVFEDKILLEDGAAVLLRHPLKPTDFGAHDLNPSTVKRLKSLLEDQVKDILRGNPQTEMARKQSIAAIGAWLKTAKKAQDDDVTDAMTRKDEPGIMSTPAGPSVPAPDALPRSSLRRGKSVSFVKENDKGKAPHRATPVASPFRGTHVEVPDDAPMHAYRSIMARHGNAGRDFTAIGEELNFRSLASQIADIHKVVAGLVAQNQIKDDLTASEKDQVPVEDTDLRGIKAVDLFKQSNATVKGESESKSHVDRLHPTAEIFRGIMADKTGSNSDDTSLQAAAGSDTTAKMNEARTSDMDRYVEHTPAGFTLDDGLSGETSAHDIELPVSASLQNGDVVSVRHELGTSPMVPATYTPTGLPCRMTGANHSTVG